MAILNLEAIKQKQSAAAVDVFVAQWGGDVRIAKLGAKQKVQLARAYARLPKTDDGEPIEDTVELLDFIVALLSFSLVDEGGSAMFDGREGRDFLARQDQEVLTTLATAAIELNGFSAKAEQAAAEQAEKN